MGPVGSVGGVGSHRPRPRGVAESSERFVSSEADARTLAVMTTAGMYERSGEWLVRVALPGK
ncbi:MAG: glutaminase, partial [Ornithinibacter sp.]